MFVCIAQFLSSHHDDVLDTRPMVGGNATNATGAYTIKDESGAESMIEFSGSLFSGVVAGMLVLTCGLWLVCLRCQRPSSYSNSPGKTSRVIPENTRGGVGSALTVNKAAAAGGGVAATIAAGVVDSAAGASPNARDFIAKRMESVRADVQQIDRARADAKHEQMKHLKKKLSDKGITSSAGMGNAEETVPAGLADTTIEKLQSVMDDEARLLDHRKNSKDLSVRHTSERRAERKRNRTKMDQTEEQEEEEKEEEADLGGAAKSGGLY